MKINYTKIVLGALLLLSVFSLKAQSARLYTTAEGLPSSHISQLVFDAQNFLWVSTDYGLSRFNGEHFDNFQAEIQNPYRLQENQINFLHIDNDGKYWVAGSDGLYYFDHAFNSFRFYPLSTTRQDISVAGIVDHPFREHTLILASYGWGVRVFDTESCAFDSLASQQLHNQLLRSPMRILIDKIGRLWAFEDNEIEVVDLQNMQTIQLSKIVPEIAHEGLSITHVVEVRPNDCIYLGTGNRGVLAIDLQSMKMHRLPVDVSDITALAMGPDGFLYIGTETQGLWIYQPEKDEAFPLVSSNLLRFGQGKIHSIAFDSQKNLWLGLYQKGVVVLPRRESGVFTRQPISFVKEGGPNLASVTGFAPLPDGGRAYALDGAGVVLDYADGQHVMYSTRNSALATDAVLAITSLPDGTVLVGTYMHGVYVIAPDRKLRRDPRLSALDKSSITDFEHDQQNSMLYIATNGSGLYALDYLTNKISCPVPEQYGIKWINNLFLGARNRRLWVSRADHLSCIDLVTGEVCQPRQPRSRVVINGFAETNDGELWLASNYGLLHYDTTLDSLMLVEDAEKQHLHYSALMSGEDGRLWLASAGCITMYDTQQHRFVDYMDPTIAEVGTINYHSSKRWPDGTFSFGGDNGVINFSQDGVDNYQHPSHQLLLTSLWVDNVPTDYDPMLGGGNMLDRALWCAQQLTLPNGRASFSVSFALQDIGSETGISYSYRLKGYDNEWHRCHGGSRTANYHELPFGDYVLEVKATRENDETEQAYVERQLRVCVLAPWYATWWAWLIWVALAVAIIWVALAQILEHRKARHELREAETQRRMKEGKLNLLTSVSHEIRTPLTLIISPLRKMMKRKLDPATQSVLEMMYRNSLRILMLVNQQMDVRKLDKGELPLHVKELPLLGFLDDMMQYFRSMALSRHITYSLSLPDGENEMTLWVDPTQFDKVVMNLLSNAIKFVPDGGKVSVEVSRLDRDHTRITVYNSGSQLPEGQQDAAFAGIGLSIAREITELHHGTLTVRNLEDGVAFDIDMLEGCRHFTTLELAAVPKVESNEERYEPEAEIADGVEGERLEVVTQATAQEEDNDRELVEQLNDELRETQRLRERRTSLDDHQEPEKMSSGDEKLLRRVMDLVHKNMSDSEFSVESLSTELGISRVHLNRKLKELLDISPSALIKSVRLKQAALLLIQSNVTVAEVAYSVGFSSPAYFTTNFTQYYGMTPKEFCNTYTENPDSPELKQLLGK